MPFLPRLHSSFFLFLALFMLETSSVGFGQVNLEQKVTYQSPRQNLLTHLSSLEEQFDLSFTYSLDFINYKKKTAINIRQQPLALLLNQLGKKYRFSYRQFGQQIVLKEQTALPLSSLPNETPESVAIPAPLVQTIRGRIIDAQSKQPLIGANLFLLQSEDFKGTSSDENGEFSLTQVPLGRHTLEATYIGYESLQLTGLKVISGKENYVVVEMTESANILSEIVVKAKIDKTTPLNEMAGISARAFSVEETSRFAGSFLDPARMAKSFPGVSFINDLDNEVVVRGNPPVSLLWRLEGVPIPNPNHFGVIGGSSGAISMLSSNTLANSDFLTGAFPSEYGNTLSGVFDLKMRNGNKVKRESNIMLGTLGIDFSSEGPFSKKSSSSYLFNYRYSSLKFLDKLGVNPDQNGAVPNYQDLSFKLHFPTAQKGVFSLFGLAGINRYNAVMDFREENDINDLFEEKSTNSLAIMGISHVYPFSGKDYLSTTLAFSTNEISYNLDRLAQVGISTMESLENEHYYFLQGSLAINYTRKFNAQHHLRLGFLQTINHFDLTYGELNYNSFDSIHYILLDKGQTRLLQSHLQWQFRPNQHWTLNLGFHQMFYSHNQAFTFEPRASGEWRFSANQAISFGIGKHSFVGDISTYLARRVSETGLGIQPFKALDIAKAWHFVTGYQLKLAHHWHLKTEIYYQYLFDVPVSTSADYPLQTTFNIVNNYDILNAVSLDFVNEGVGRNYGLELTVEKFFAQQYYLLFTGSLYDARYLTFDEKVFSTRFNGNFILNLATGREWLIKNKHLMSVNGRLVVGDGNRYTPIDEEASKRENRQVLLKDQIYANKTPNYYRIDFGLTYTHNQKKLSHAFQFDIQNLFNIRNLSEYFYARTNEKVVPVYQTGIIPVFYYKLSF